MNVGFLKEHRLILYIDEDKYRGHAINRQCDWRALWVWYQYGSCAQSRGAATSQHDLLGLHWKHTDRTGSTATNCILQKWKLHNNIIMSGLNHCIGLRLHASSWAPCSSQVVCPAGSLLTAQPCFANQCAVAEAAGRAHCCRETCTHQKKKGPSKDYLEDSVY